MSENLAIAQEELMKTEFQGQSIFRMLSKATDDVGINPTNGKAYWNVPQIEINSDLAEGDAHEMKGTKISAIEADFMPVITKKSLSNSEYNNLSLRSETSRSLFAMHQHKINVQVLNDTIALASIPTTDLLSLVANASATKNNPADCNATPGTADPLSASIWTGATKTAAALDTIISAFVGEIQADGRNIQYLQSFLHTGAGNVFDRNKFVLFIEARAWDLCATQTTLLNATTGDLGATPTEIFSSKGIIVIPVIGLHADYTGATDHTNVSVVANPQEFVGLYRVVLESGTWIQDANTREWTAVYSDNLAVIIKPIYNGTYWKKPVVTIDTEPAG